MLKVSNKENRTTPWSNILLKFCGVNTEFYTVNIYPFKVNNRSSWKRYAICSNLAVKTPKRRHGQTYFKNLAVWFLKNHRKVFKVCLVIGVVMSLMLTLNIFYTFFDCFYCWLWTGTCLLGKTLKIFLF